MRILCAATSILALLSAGSAAAETLNEAISSAYASNPALLAQRAEVRALDEDYVQARSAYGPTLSLSEQTAYQYDHARVAPGVSTTNQGVGGPVFALSATQPIYSFGRIRARVNAAEALILAGREVLRQTESDVLTNVISTYVAVRRDRRIVEIVQENVALVDRQFTDTETRFRARETTATDLAQARSRLASAKAALVSAQSARATSESRYLAVVGHPPGTLEPGPDLANMPATITEAIESADANNPALSAARYRELASRAGVAEARAAFGPTFSLRIDASQSAVSLYNNDNRQDNLTASGVVQMPLFASGLNTSRVRQSKQRNLSNQQLVDLERRSAVQAVAQAWNELAEARNTLELNAQAAAAALVAYQGAREEQRLGLRTTLDVLNQAQEVQSTGLRVVQNEADEYVARASLLAATGKLQVTAVTTGVEVYDPEKSFRSVKWRGDVPWTPAIHALDGVTTIGADKRPPTSNDPAVKHLPVVAPAMPPAPPIR